MDQEIEGIFSFNDGDKTREIDGWKVSMELFSDTFVIAAEQATSGDNKAIQTMIAEIRRVFEIPEWKRVDGVISGLTDLDTMKVFKRFTEWSDSIKKNIEQFAT